MCIVLIQLIEDINWTKWLNKKELLPDCLIWVPFPILRRKLKGQLLGLKTASFLTAAYTIGSPQSPACQLQTWGLLSFHNLASQFLILYRYVIYIYILKCIHIHTKNVITERWVNFPIREGANAEGSLESSNNFNICKVVVSLCL